MTYVPIRIPTHEIWIYEHSFTGTFRFPISEWLGTHLSIVVKCFVSFPTLFWHLSTMSEMNLTTYSALRFISHYIPCDFQQVFPR